MCEDPNDSVALCSRIFQPWVPLAGALRFEGDPGVIVGPSLRDVPGLREKFDSFPAERVGQDS